MYRSPRLRQEQLRRAAQARYDLQRLRGRNHQFPDVPSLPQPGTTRLRTSLWVGHGWRYLSHGVIIAIVLIFVAVEGQVRISAQAGLFASRSHIGDGFPSAPQPVEAANQANDGAIQAGFVDESPTFLADDWRPSAVEVAVAPPEQRPQPVLDAFRAVHTLRSGETLGQVAAQYDLSLAELIWANDLTEGDALMDGQQLRIPLIAGVPYRVVAGDTIGSIAAQFGTEAAAIIAFGPNRLNPTIDLAAGLPSGLEIFIPGQRELPSQLLSQVGGEAALAERGPVAAAQVRDDRTNLREGPSVDHVRVGELARAQVVELIGRNRDWLKVAGRGVVGWVRGDLVAVDPQIVAELPTLTDFPEPPPRWVWPARGTITSRFGPRWGSFHNGLDIANRAWTPIVAARSGRVVEAGWCRGYGYCVKIAHGGGVVTHYGHLVAQPPVRAGTEVAAGELIGYMGSTYDRSGGGYSTGVHLHLTVLVNGRAVDPLKFLP